MSIQKKGPLGARRKASNKVDHHPLITTLTDGSMQDSLYLRRHWYCRSGETLQHHVAVSSTAELAFFVKTLGSSPYRASRQRYISDTSPAVLQSKYPDCIRLQVPSLINTPSDIVIKHWHHEIEILRTVSWVDCLSVIASNESKLVHFQLVWAFEQILPFSLNRVSFW